MIFFLNRSSHVNTGRTASSNHDTENSQKVHSFRQQTCQVLENTIWPPRFGHTMENHTGKLHAKFQVPNLLSKCTFYEFSVSQFKGFECTVFTDKSRFSRNLSSGQKHDSSMRFFCIVNISMRSLKKLKLFLDPPNPPPMALISGNLIQVSKIFQAQIKFQENRFKQI